MDKITGELIQNGTPTPDNPVPVETRYKVNINGIDYDLGKCLNIKEVYEKDGKWYIEWR